MVVQVERDEVERPFVAQLKAMGWTHVPGTEIGTLDTGTPFLVGQLDAALHRINARAADRKPWMDDSDARRSITALASVPLGKGVAQANFDTTHLLLSGHVRTGPSAEHGGPSATVQWCRLPLGVGRGAWAALTGLARTARQRPCPPMAPAPDPPGRGQRRRCGVSTRGA